MATDVLTRPAKAKRSPERETLAVAIEALDAAAHVLQSTAEAHAEVERKFEGTRSKHYAADTALDEAKTALADALRMHGGDEAAAVAHALKIGRDPPREAVDKAEREYQRTKEAFDYGTQGRNTAKGTKLAAEDALGYAERKVSEAAERVCWSMLPELATRAERARAEWLAAKSVLSLVAQNFDGVQRNYMSSTDPLAKRIRSLALFEPDFNGVRAASDAAGTPWQVSFKALLIDPDAQLPE